MLIDGPGATQGEAIFGWSAWSWSQARAGHIRSQVSVYWEHHP